MTGLPVSGRLGPVPDGTEPEPTAPVDGDAILNQVEDDMDEDEYWWTQ